MNNEGLNLPLADKAGRGALEAEVVQLAREMVKAGQGRDPHEFKRLEKRLDKARQKFHDMYGKKPSPLD